VPTLHTFVKALNGVVCEGHQKLGGSAEAEGEGGAGHTRLLDQTEPEPGTGREIRTKVLTNPAQILQRSRLWKDMDLSPTTKYTFDGTHARPQLTGFY